MIFKMPSHKEIRAIRDKINNLSYTEHMEIFKILQDKCNFTQNNNGIFFSISTLDDDSLQQINEFVNFCIENQVKLDEYDRKYNECRHQNCFERLIDMPQTLDNVLSNNSNTNNIEEILKNAKDNKRVEMLMNIIETHTEKLFKKNTSTKYLNAKKKYAKKMITEEKKSELEQNDLTIEEYIISI